MYEYFLRQMLSINYYTENLRYPTMLTYRTFVPKSYTARLSLKGTMMSIFSESTIKDKCYHRHDSNASSS